MKRENLEEKDILNKIDQSITQLDEQRLQGLNNFKQIQEIKTEVYKLERSRLIKKYGQDHPRVRKAEVRLANNQEMFSGLEEEIERAKIKKESLPNNAWRVHGRVFSKDNAPLKAHTVYLSEEKQQANQNLPYACTDDSGYFSMTIQEGEVASLEKSKLYLAVLNEKRKVIYTAPEPIYPKKGLIEYRHLCVASEGCETPPFNENNIKNKRSNTKEK